MRMLPVGRRVLWKLSRSGQQVRCEVCQHPFGVELRYVTNGKQLMSRVFEDWDALERAAGSWYEGLRLRGWSAAGPGHNLASAS
jgi:hypothetical protein